MPRRNRRAKARRYRAEPEQETPTLTTNQMASRLVSEGKAPWAILGPIAPNLQSIDRRSGLDLDSATDQGVGS